MAGRGTGRFPWYPLLLVAVLLVVAITLWHPLLQLTRDAARAREWLASLGPWGPVALVVVNAIQIVFAPIPGYFVQLAGGYLFGIWRGALCGIGGMLTGGTLAMLLARRFGRPFVERWLGTGRMDRWEQVIHADAVWIWFLLMAGPVGDIPYYLAGLTRVPLWKILGIVLVTRGPSVGLAAAMGAGAVSLSPRWLLAITVATLSVVILLYQLGRRMAGRFEAFILHRMDQVHAPQE